MNTALNRRLFLTASTAVGGGFVLGFSLPANEAEAASAAPEVNAWIVIQPDDTIIVRVAHSEMGQGAFTSLPMMVAEELNADWSKVKPEFINPTEHVQRGKIWGGTATVGSRAVRTSHEYLRKAGASAREMLIAAAAQQWKVPASEVKAEKSVLTHTSSGRTLTYGKVGAAASRMTPPKDVALKPHTEWTIIGKPLNRVEIPDKVMGKPVFAIDVRLPEMLYAAIEHSPSFGGKLKSVNEAAVKGMPGVRAVVPLFDNAVAVVADSYFEASQALTALPIEWDRGPNGNVNHADLRAFVNSGLTATDAVEGAKEGDVADAFTKAAKVIEAEYHAPYLSHVPMEPQNGTARVTADLVEIWAPTQNIEATLNLAARAAGVDIAKVKVHPVMAGGGFGRRGGQLEYVTESVTLSKMLGKPVQVIWSREEDIRHDFYRPISAAKFKAGFDAQGKAIAWDTRIAGHSIMATANPEALKKGPDLGFLVCFTDNPYDVPNRRVDFGMRNSHVPVGYWRSVNHSQNGYFRECFVDEMAEAAGVDPYEFRRKLLANAPKQLAVMDAAAKAAGWGRTLPAGVFQGIAQVDGYGSYVASVVEASVRPDGHPKVHRVVTAIDCGHVVNPDTVKAQTEGAVAWALSAAFYGEITIRNGGVEQGNYHDYPMVKMAEMPIVETVLVPSYDFWGGVGEPGAPPVTPALLNAMYKATGRRIRNLPIVKDSQPRSAD
jgi:isoquinoline 1-oxidoreductase beta subunit